MVKNRLHSLILHEAPSKMNWYHFSTTVRCYIHNSTSEFYGCSISFASNSLCLHAINIIPLGLGIMEEKQKWIQQYNIYEFCYDFTVHVSVYELHNYCKDLIHFITIYIWKWYLWYMKRENRFIYIYIYIVDHQLVYYYKGISTFTCQSDALWRFVFHINWNVCLIYCNQMVNCYLV